MNTHVDLKPVTHTPPQSSIIQSSILMQQSDITEASLEAILVLDDAHRDEVLRLYRSDMRYKIMIDAAVCYLAVRISMAKTAMMSLVEFNRIALNPAPWFVNEFDVQQILKKLMHETEMDPDTSDVLVDLMTFNDRLNAIKSTLYI